MLDNKQRQNDDDLIGELQAFGRTIEAATGETIRPTSQSDDAGASHRETSTVTEGSTGVRRSAWWLVAAAALLLSAGFGLGVLWPKGATSIDSVGTSDQDGEDQDNETETVDTQIPDSDRSATTMAQSDDPAPGQQPSAEDGAFEAAPSIIERADGSILMEVDDFEPGADDTDEEARAKVAVIAVADELLRLDVFAGFDRTEVLRQLTTGGLTIRTTLDPVAEAAAVSSISEHLPAQNNRPHELGLVTIDNRDGSIIAIGSSNPGSDVPLRVPQGTGSIFKTFVLAAMFDNDYSPNDTVRADGPCAFPLEDEGYVVGGTERQVQTVADVTRSSNNCAFVRLGQIIGLDKVTASANAMGVSVEEEFEDFPGLPLGVTPVTVVDMAGAYATIARGGLYEQPWLVASVQDRTGAAIYEHRFEQTRAMSQEATTLVTNVLEGVVEAGTGRRALLDGGHVAAGKTGTRPDFDDAWFVGYTDYYTTAVWLGDPEGDVEIRIPEWNSFGGGLPAFIWGDYMNRIHEGLTPRQFDQVPTTEGRLLEFGEELPSCGEPDQTIFQAVAIDSDADGVVDCVQVP